MMEGKQPQRTTACPGWTGGFRELKLFQELQISLIKRAKVRLPTEVLSMQLELFEKSKIS